MLIFLSLFSPNNNFACRCYYYFLFDFPVLSILRDLSGCGWNLVTCVVLWLKSAFSITTVKCSLCICSRPWTTRVWTVQIHFYTYCFNKYLYYFLSAVVGAQLCLCMHWSMPYLSIRRFWYLWGALEPISLGMPRDNLSFGGLGSYTWIFDYVRVGTPNPSVAEGSTA